MQAAPARDPSAPFSPPGANVAIDAVAFMRSVYRWMALGLVLTGVVAAFVAANPPLYQMILGTPLFWGLLIAELIMVVVFSRSVRKVGFGTAAAMFTTYCALSGLTFSVFFIVYTAGSLALAFYVCGGMFAAMSAYGTLTKNDLSSWGSMAFMALIGLILAGVVNFIFHSTLLEMAISVVSVFVFTALTAYDTQKIRTLAAAGDRRLALAGALELYLDFVNLFIALLRLFGRRR
jgi:FtsH-binding integral membrane protein